MFIRTEPQLFHEKLRPRVGSIIQIKINGDATLCCTKLREDDVAGASSGLVCGGAANICQHFYDSAPSGCYGTMTYLVRALAQTLNCLPKDGRIDCNIA